MRFGWKNFDVCRSLMAELDLVSNIQNYTGTSPKAALSCAWQTFSLLGLKTHWRLPRIYLEGYLTKSSQLNHKQTESIKAWYACVHINLRQARTQSIQIWSLPKTNHRRCLSRDDYWQPACRESKVVILIKFTFQLAKAAAKYRRLLRRCCCWMPLQTALW